MSGASLRTPASHRETRQRRAPLPFPRAEGFHSYAAPAVLYSSPLRSAELVLQFQSFDAGYVAKLCAGDSQTQEHFVTYFSELLQVKLRSRLQSLHAIEDVRQETFARVFAVLRKDGGLRQPERLGPFVNTVCNHVLMEHYRSSGRSDSLDAEGQPELPARGASSLDIVAARQIKEKVREILLDLAPRDRALLNAVFLDERDRDEVCKEFGVDRDYLRVLLHRAKQEFKTEYMKRIGDQASMRASA
jgi:RNA polymerase sigma-70 factor (ECF subfamily)